MSKNNNFYYFRMVFVLIIIIILLYLNMKYFSIDKFTDIITNNVNNINNGDFEKNTEVVLNPYIKVDKDNINEKHKILWQKLDNNFMKSNWPNTFDFDFDIKDDIIKKALTLPLNSGIIDCGAHIGDGSIAISHALKYYNREDIIIYAIDPSKYKCDFIEFIKSKNNLNNLIVLNYGLSNINTEYKTLKQSGNNTGGWEWVANDTSSSTPSKDDMNNINKFIKLDDLIKDNIIKHNIAIIHLDVEGMEKEALIGGKETIEKYKPYISIENNDKSGKDNNGKNHSSNNEYYLNFLPKGYKYLYSKGQNNILSI